VGGVGEIMENKVYYLHSTLEIPLLDVEDCIKNLNPPEGLDRADLKRRSNTLIISAIVEDSDLGKYTPTAVIKGTVTELKIMKELTEEEEEALEPDQERPMDIVEIATFKGELDAILQNTAFQYQMFQVLREIAGRGNNGTLEAIFIEEDQLEAVKITEGEIKPSVIKIVEERSDVSAESAVNWRDNKFIN
jgi:hypothetical protein